MRPGTLSVPSTRAYAMKQGYDVAGFAANVRFQYPQLGPTR